MILFKESVPGPPKGKTPLVRVGTHRSALSLRVEIFRLSSLSTMRIRVPLRRVCTGDEDSLRAAHFRHQWLPK